MEDDWNFLDAHGPTGVGRYDSDWDFIEAEWYMVGVHVEKVQINNATNNELLLGQNPEHQQSEESMRPSHI